MHKKPLISAILTVLCLGIFFGYSLVFGAGDSYTGPTRIEYTTGKNIYTASTRLNQTKILFQSSYDLSKLDILSECDTFSKFVGTSKDYYLFELKYFTDCDSPEIRFEYQGEEIFSQELEIVNEYDLWKKFVDYSDTDLQKFQSFISQRLQKLQSKEIFSGAMKKQAHMRQIQETLFVQDFLQKLLQLRSEKYLIPVKGYDMPTNHSKIPNAGRPYRASYTDGIHHGWDVGTKLGEEVRALDEGMIIRVVRDFVFEDLNELNKSAQLTYEDELKNLDILRGNQVWLKTAKGDVVFYSHLKDVYGYVQEGMIVRKGEALGTIGISGVPQKDYTDYHLHFAVHKNPYNRNKVGKYDYEDYMKWKWYFQDQSRAEILKYQNDIFTR